MQYGNESRLPWYGHLPQLPGNQATYAEEDPRGYLPRILASNRQHPDHDTDEWPPKAGR